MSFTRPLLTAPCNWNWDGDQICRDTVVTTLRWVPGKSEKETYPMDVRELLGTERNALIKLLLPDIQAYGQELYRSSPRPFSLQSDREAGAFDRRAFVIRAYVETRIRYTLRNEALWQFPDETIFLAEGDCEDRAVLLATLLLASGISPYNVRVALGKVLVTTQEEERREGPHCWVMYKSETGRWLTLELEDRTVPAVPTMHAHPDVLSLTQARQVTYEPCYLFNGDHVWVVKGHGNRESTEKGQLDRRWSSIHPTFIGAVHKSIVDTALAGVAISPVLTKLNSLYTNLFGQVIDRPDLNPFAYNPLDHFDNGLIQESWKLVKKRLDTFRARRLDDGEGSEAFAFAAHGIADFYAHSTFGHHAVHDQRPPEPYRPVNPSDWAEYPVTNPIPIGSAPFSINGQFWKGTPAAAQGHWAEKLFSGRYGQPGDSQEIHSSIGLPFPRCPAPSQRSRGGLRAEAQRALPECVGRRRSVPLAVPGSLQPYQTGVSFPSRGWWRTGLALRAYLKLSG